MGPQRIFLVRDCITNNVSRLPRRVLCSDRLYKLYEIDTYMYTPLPLLCKLVSENFNEFRQLPDHPFLDLVASNVSRGQFAFPSGLNE